MSKKNWKESFELYLKLNETEVYDSNEEYGFMCGFYAAWDIQQNKINFHKNLSDIFKKERDELEGKLKMCIEALEDVSIEPHYGYCVLGDCVCWVGTAKHALSKIREQKESE